MCKFCNCTKEDVSDEYVTNTIGMGDIPDLFGLDLRVDRCPDPVLRLELYVIEGCDNISTNTVKIKYCPFCGEKL